MGCGCGKNKPNLKGPRDIKRKKILNIDIPKNMTPDQRRATVVKVKNARNKMAQQQIKENQQRHLRWIEDTKKNT